MTDQELQRARERLVAKIHEVSDYELQDVSRSEQSFFNWLKAVLVQFVGAVIGYAARRLWE